MGIKVGIPSKTSQLAVGKLSVLYVEFHLVHFGKSAIVFGKVVEKVIRDEKFSFRLNSVLS